MKHCAILILLTSLLSACGGGGASNTNAAGTLIVEPPKVCSNGGTDYPICTPPYVPAKLQLTVPEPPYEVGSEMYFAFQHLNDIRRSMGLGLLAYSKELTIAAEAHRDYLVLNKTFGFDEEPGKLGFYGATNFDRIKRAGYLTEPSLTSGTLGAALSAKGNIIGLMGTIYHRSVLIDQSFMDVGMGLHIYPESVVKHRLLSLTIGTKSKNGQYNASDYVGIYPIDGATEVDLTMYPETPNPFPQDYPGGLPWGKVGYPISVSIAKGSNLQIKSFTLTPNGESKPIDTYVLTKDSDPQKLIASNEAFLVSKTVLKPSTTYRVKLIALINELNFERTWSITTSQSAHPDS